MKVVEKGSEISDRCQVSTFTHVSEPELLTVENQVISIEYFTFNINTSHDPIFFRNFETVLEGILVYYYTSTSTFSNKIEYK